MQCSRTKLNALVVLGCILSGAVDGRRNVSRGSPPLTETRIVQRLLRDYDKNQPPPDGPTDVKLGIYVHSFNDVSEQAMDYTMTIYLRQQWVDKRLKFDPINNRNHQRIRLGQSAWSSIWSPDLFFRNEKTSAFHSMTVPNQLVRLKNNGELFTSTKITVTLSCPMNLQKFPMDKQSCPVIFESYGYTMDDLTLSWLSEKEVDLDPSVTLPRFTLRKTIKYNCSKSYTTGSFPCLEINFILERDTGFYAMQIYVPAIFVVVLSWIAFWFAVDSTAARVSIGLVTILTMFLLSVWSRSQLPRVSYITAMDVWMSVCLMFIFASFMETAIVNFIARKKIPESPRQDEGIALKQMNDSRDASQAARQNPASRRRANRVNLLARILFPVAFFVFNAIYWTIYLI